MYIYMYMCVCIYGPVPDCVYTDQCLFVSQSSWGHTCVFNALWPGGAFGTGPLGPGTLGPREAHEGQAHQGTVH